MRLRLIPCILAAVVLSAPTLSCSLRFSMNNLTDAGGGNSNGEDDVAGNDNESPYGASSFLTTTDISGAGSSDLLYASVLQTDGKIVTGGVSAAEGVYYAVLARYDKEGDLDDEFGTDGIVILTSGVSLHLVQSIAIQADGKILAAVVVYDGSSYNFALYRCESDGSLDTSFNRGGSAGKDFAGNRDWPYAVSVQEDGKILIAGEADMTGSDSDAAVLRYNSDGSLDSSFGTDGAFVLDIRGDGGVDRVYSMMVQSDGKIVLGGSSMPNGSFASDLVLLRLKTDGSLDETFGTGGIAISNIGEEGKDQVLSMALQSDSKIVVAGSSKLGGNDNFLVARYNTSGVLDNTFGENGVYILDVQGESGSDTVYSVGIQSDGKIIAGGYSKLNDSTNPDFALIRLNTQGALDVTFDDDGIKLIDVGTSSNDHLYSVIVQPNDKIVAAGYYDTDGRGANDFILTRF